MKDIMILMKLDPDLERDPEESKLQQDENMDNVFTVDVKEEVLETLKEEAVWADSDAAGEAAALASLYAGHKVKDELVLGPEDLQPRDIAFTLYAHANSEQQFVKVKVEHSSGYESHEIETSEAGSEELINRPPPEPCVPSSKRADTPTGAAARGPPPSATPIQQHIYHTLNYICYICKKQYTQSNTLQRHMRTHTGENMSDICASGKNRTKKIKYVNALKEQPIHTGENYSCDKCQMVFTEHIPFLRHQRTHRQFACAICKRQFSRMEHLRSHELVHKDVKPFSCYICKEQFMTSEQLLTHTRVHVPAEKEGGAARVTQPTAPTNRVPTAAVRLHKGPFINCVIYF